MRENVTYLVLIHLQSGESMMSLPLGDRFFFSYSDVAESWLVCVR